MKDNEKFEFDLKGGPIQLKTDYECRSSTCDKVANFSYYIIKN